MRVSTARVTPAGIGMASQSVQGSSSATATFVFAARLPGEGCGTEMDDTDAVPPADVQAAETARAETERSDRSDGIRNGRRSVMNPRIDTTLQPRAQRTEGPVRRPLRHSTGAYDSRYPQFAQRNVIIRCMASFASLSPVQMDRCGVPSAHCDCRRCPYVLSTMKPSSICEVHFGQVGLVISFLVAFGQASMAKCEIDSAETADRSGLIHQGMD